MKYTTPLLSIRPLAIILAAVAAGGLLTLAPAVASAQTTKTIDGLFKFKDGNKGTYVTTITTNGDTTTEQTVYTRSSDKATSTDTRTVTMNADGTRSVTSSSNDFGATAQFTASKVVTLEKHGEAYGNGTYTTPAGISGVLTTLESNIGNIEAVNAAYTTSTGTTRDLRLKDSELNFTGEKFITLNPDGTITTAVHDRFVTHTSSN